MLLEMLLNLTKTILIGYLQVIQDSVMINPGHTRIIAINGSTNSGVLNNADRETKRFIATNGSIGDER